MKFSQISPTIRGFSNLDLKMKSLVKIMVDRIFGQSQGGLCLYIKTLEIYLVDGWPSTQKNRDYDHLYIYQCFKIPWNGMDDNKKNINHITHITWRFFDHGTFDGWFQIHGEFHQFHQLTPQFTSSYCFSKTSLDACNPHLCSFAVFIYIYTYV